MCSLVSHILSEPIPDPGHQGGGGGNQWGNSNPWQSSGKNSFGGGSGHGGAGEGFGQNPGQRGGRGAGGAGNGAGQSYPSNSYNDLQKYGYDYTIPGADVHFAAFREAGGNSCEYISLQFL